MAVLPDLVRIAVGDNQVVRNESVRHIFLIAQDFAIDTALSVSHGTNYELTPKEIADLKEKADYLQAILDFELRSDPVDLPNVYPKMLPLLLKDIPYPVSNQHINRMVQMFMAFAEQAIKLVDASMAMNINRRGYETLSQIPAEIHKYLADIVESGLIAPAMQNMAQPEDTTAITEDFTDAL